MIIDGRQIGAGHSPYIIAEVSGNHNGSFDKACGLIKAAKESGADAVKFQAYTPDTITLNHNSEDFFIKDGPWAGQSLYDLYAKAHTPFEWFEGLFACARALGITPFASVFDKSSVDMLEKLHCPAYKIASFEITDIPLIEYAAATGKSLIISTGMAVNEDIWAIEGLRIPGDRYAFLHCVSGYPTNAKDSNLMEMRNWMKTHCGFPLWGLSDHTLGSDIPIAATALGACIIEKHLMLGDEHTEDFEFSLAPLQFAQMVRSVRNIWQAMQPSKVDVEETSRPFRRSLYIVKDMARGEPFTEENVRSIRPAYGLAPRELPWVLTKTAAQDLKRGTALKSEHIAS